MAILMFMLGCCSSGFILAFAVTRENNPAEISGTAIGFINMLNTFSVAFFQYFIGRVLDWTASDITVVGGERVFSLADYQAALLCIPVCLAVAFFVLLPLHETFCQSKL